MSDVTGAVGSFVGSATVYWTVDPARGDVVAVAETHLRAMLFHELHHLVREAATETETLMDRVILEGMASAFERDFAGATYPWTRYPADVSAWVDELLALPEETEHRPWMSRHPDGRRWIGYKAGRASGRSAAALVSVSTADIVAVSDVATAEAESNR